MTSAWGTTFLLMHKPFYCNNVAMDGVTTRALMATIDNDNNDVV